jgi:hypothetical protein
LELIELTVLQEEHADWEWRPIISLAEDGANISPSIEAGSAENHEVGHVLDVDPVQGLFSPEAKFYGDDVVCKKRSKF